MLARGKRQRTEGHEIESAKLYDARDAVRAQDRIFHSIPRQGPTPLYLLLRWEDSSGYDATVVSPNLDFNTFRWVLDQPVEGYDNVSVIAVMMSNSYSTANPVMSFLGISIPELSTDQVKTTIDGNVGTTGINGGAQTLPLTISGRIPITFIVPNQTYLSGAFGSTALWTYIDDGKDMIRCNIGLKSVKSITMTLTDETLQPLTINGTVTKSTYHFHTLLKFW